MTDRMNLEQLIFEIISYGGEARAKAYQALEAVRAQASKEEVSALLKESHDSMTKAHNIQTKLVQAELQGEEGIQPTLLLIHAQDQLMTAMAEKALIEQLIDMQEEINELKRLQEK